MLVLDRHKGERIFILTPAGEEIVVTLVSTVRGHRGKIGIDAPPAYSIAREEIADDIRRAHHHRRTP